MSTPTYLQQHIGQAIEQRDLKPLAEVDRYAASLLALLDVLGRHDFEHELVEALPHLAEQIDLIDVRNIMVDMGYESAHIAIKTKDLAQGLFPALFVANNGRILVLLHRDGDHVEYFDAQSGTFKSDKLPKLKGTAYLFTEIPQHVKTQEGREDSWFNNLVHRFRRLIIYLLGMTLMINVAALMVPIFVMLVYQKVIAVHSTDSLPYLVAGILILLVGELSLRIVRAGLIGAVAGRLDYLIGVETFRKIIYLPPANLERSSVSAQLSRVHQFDAVREFFTGQSASTALELPFVIVFVLFMGFLAGPIALIPVLVIVIYIVFSLLWMPSLNAKTKRSAQARTEKDALVLQTLTGRPEVKAVAAEDLWQQRFREHSADAVMAQRETYASQGVLATASQSLTMLASVAILGFGSQAVVAGTLSIGALIATMALSIRVLAPMQSAFLMFGQARHALSAIRQINQLMRLQSEPRMLKSHLMANDIKGRIRADNISYRYASDQDPCLMNVTLHAEPGEMVAIVGATSAGKSTLLKLIGGLYRAQGGMLMLDDRDIRQLDVRELRRNIAYVPQDSEFFYGTISQNMRLSNGLASDEAVKQAASDAGVLEEIENLPKGFDTRIGDNNTQHFPPGFLRSLSMARAFLNPAPVVLLDEPGNLLDNVSDQLFVQQIKRLKTRKTIIMVSHRPSHIMLADKAVLLKRGAMQFVGEPAQAINRLMKEK